MFKTTSLFIKVVCLNNTNNLSLISSAFNNLDFFSYKKCSGRKPRNFGLSWGGGSNAYRTVSYFSCVLLDSLPMHKKLGAAQLKNHFWNTLKHIYIYICGCTHHTYMSEGGVRNGSRNGVKERAKQGDKESGRESHCGDQGAVREDWERVKKGHGVSGGGAKMEMFMDGFTELVREGVREAEC